ncbi:MAG: phosphopantothenoylcysteine decarboxylase [Cyanobacteria bacterium K_Offshore_surface_m2_239]|nr:phosphopantothenoylcysteine decarboxylase [Cyanobacteria bacterium K_Offshore_surface_m2_239]
MGGAFEWGFTPPASTAIGDHDVPQLSRHLDGRRIALLVGCGIAAMKAPMLARALRRRGAVVTAFCTADALRYVGAEALEWSTCRPLVRELTWRAEHLSDDEDFAAYLVAPATYNTIGKLAGGIADTVLTATLASAMGRLARGETAVLLAPTMHGTLHNPLLEANCRRLAALGVRFVPPRDAYGKHNLPDEELLVAAVCRALSASPLRERRVLVTGGPTPVPLDGVRRITGRFRGQLGAAIHEELLRRGADSRLVLGDGGWRPPSWLPAITIAPTYDAYMAQVLAEVAAGAEAAVFSAAVADYRPREAVAGKVPSGRREWRLELEPTEKVIERAAAAAPGMPIVSFKYLEGVSHGELMAEARRRLARYAVVVANRGEEISEARQVAWIVTAAGERRVEGKPAIAFAIADALEALLAPQAEVDGSTPADDRA